MTRFPGHKFFALNSKLSGMNFLLLCIAFSSAAFTAVSASPQLQVIAPARFEKFAVIPPSTAADIVFKYNVTDSAVFQPQICLSVVSDLGSVVVEAQCTKMDSPQGGLLTIRSIPTGKYSIISGLSMTAPPYAIFPSTETVTDFSIQHIEDFLPELFFEKNTVNYAAKRGTNESSEIEFFFGTNWVNGDIFRGALDVCFNLVGLGVGSEVSEKTEVVTITCFDIENKNVKVPRLRVGRYIANFFLHEKRAPLVFEKSKISTTIAVTDITNLMPTIIVPSGIIEIAADTAQSPVSVPIPFEIIGQKSAISQIQPCVYLEESTTKNRILDVSCLEPSLRQINIGTVPPGNYNVAIFPRYISEPKEYITKRAVIINVDIQPLKEYIPTYEWQPLKPWHTVPAGIETRLPVGSDARKEARIPDPFRLQLTLPQPCNFFMRVDLYRKNTIGQIKEAAYSQCSRIPPECLMLTSLIDGTEIKDDQTVESSGLFYKQLVLKVKDSCFQQSTTKSV